MANLKEKIKALEAEVEESDKENKSIDLLADKIDRLTDTIVDSNEEMMATFVEGTKRIVKKDGIDVSPSLNNLSKSITEGLEAVKSGVSEVERSVKEIKMPSGVDFRATGSMLKLPIKELTRAVQNKEELPRNADDPISVRLSDGENFYKALDTIMQTVTGGGGTSYAFDTQGGGPTKGATVQVSVDGKPRDVIAVINPDGSRLPGGMHLNEFDYMSTEFPDTVTEIYTFKSGGSIGTTTNTVRIEYTDSTKESVSTVTKT